VISALVREPWCPARGDATAARFAADGVWLRAAAARALILWPIRRDRDWRAARSFFRGELDASRRLARRAGRRQRDAGDGRSSIWRGFHVRACGCAVPARAVLGALRVVGARRRLFLLAGVRVAWRSPGGAAGRARLSGETQPRFSPASPSSRRTRSRAHGARALVASEVVLAEADARAPPQRRLLPPRPRQCGARVWPECS
jgi:hypothetical protein